MANVTQVMEVAVQRGNEMLAVDAQVSRTIKRYRNLLDKAIEQRHWDTLEPLAKRAHRETLRNTGRLRTIAAQARDELSNLR